MVKKYLQDWYNSNDISYSEKEKLNKIGVGNYDYHYLQDLEQIIRCAKWTNNSSEIRNKIDGRIKKIIFFAPNFNDSKPDASNYSCAIVTDGDDDNWVIVYRPSYVSGIENDVAIKKVNISASEVERKLNGDYPILAMISSENMSLPGSDVEFIIPSILIDWPFVYIDSLPSDAKYNPDKYILPLDIIKRKSDIGYHFAIYLGNEWVVHFTGKNSSSSQGEGTKFDTWYTFCNSSGSSGSSRSFSSSSSSSNSESGNKTITRYHPQIPFKSKDKIIRHIAKVVSCGYGRYSYNFFLNNCEHLVNHCVFNLDSSSQVERSSFTPVSAMSFLFKDTIFVPPLEKMENWSNYLDNLTSSYSYEKGRIEQYIREADNNRSYTRPKYQIEQEKFQERIVVYPKNWCRVQ
jgi:hypothetical protein